jgi:hypothetical protein
MQLDLKDLAYLDDFSFFQIVLSSADVFPGLYRFASSWQRPKHDDGFLRLTSFVECCALTEAGKKWNRHEWLRAHRLVHELSFGEKGRNSERKEKDVGGFLEECSVAWASQERNLSLAYIDADFPVSEVTAGATYYVMGSLIHFSKDKTYVSFSKLTKEWLYELDVSFEQAVGYIQRVFGPEALARLFFRAEVIGELNFVGDEATLSFDSQLLEEALAVASPGSLVFGAFRYDRVLPIRFAKLVGVSNVCL